MTEQLLTVPDVAARLAISPPHPTTRSGRREDDDFGHSFAASDLGRYHPEQSSDFERGKG